MKKLVLLWVVIISPIQKVNDFDYLKCQTFLMQFIIDQTIRDMEKAGMFY